jgi:predicted nuclease of predicted toxin-antitoxin system
MGWDRLTNGSLLAEAEKAGFSVLLTADKGIKSQQLILGRAIAIVVIRAPNNRLDTHRALISDVLRVFATIQPGEITEVFHPDLNVGGTS